MNSKKAKFILSAIIVIMCLVIGIVIYVYKSNSEILAAKKFLKELNEKEKKIADYYSQDNKKSKKAKEKNEIEKWKVN